jgi:hypothetical protein
MIDAFDIESNSLLWARLIYFYSISDAFSHRFLSEVGLEGVGLEIEQMIAKGDFEVQEREALCALLGRSKAQSRSTHGNKNCT